MFDHRHYVPAMKWRMGEFRALQDVFAADKTRLTPLIEIPPIPWNFVEDEPARTLDLHLAQVPQQMSTYWGTAQRIFIDLGLLDPQDRMANGSHPMAMLTQQLMQAGVQVVPVTGPDRDQAYTAAVSAFHQSAGCGAVIRVQRQDFVNQQFAANLTAYVAALGLTPNDCDLILDAFSVDESQSSLLLAFLPAIIAAIPTINQWRSFTLLSGAFPVNLSDVNPGVGAIPRTDGALWQQVLQANLVRRPSFGDYCIAHPAPQEEIDPRIMHMSASVRYTAADEWLIFRGRDVRHPAFGGYGQFTGLSQLIIANAAYSQPAFSWGDDYIFRCANGQVGTGNATTWRRVGTNHHLTFVVRQLANVVVI